MGSYILQARMKKRIRMRVMPIMTHQRARTALRQIVFGSRKSGIPYRSTPPGSWNASNTVTSHPAFAMSAAHAIPAGPEPTTAIFAAPPRNGGGRKTKVLRTSEPGRAQAGSHLPAQTRPRYPRRAASMAATSILPIPIIAWKTRAETAPPSAMPSISARGVILSSMRMAAAPARP